MNTVNENDSDNNNNKNTDKDDDVKHAEEAYGMEPLVLKPKYAMQSSASGRRPSQSG
eukprot:CAMPEP_0202693154 /NCGR_PEP_ID=MMETSP1385-20130828/7353_1 /ASSEMBLY_ACC=CAM_ASM_000861 /TAXON_ID=933848 /ORGANISM="Elphidium margaritaceum" /LENGTH=56 /DNA_ID=CAMNT_0049348799 /DNA_START=9 /DNA_END=175 /DNA_ORIENTATION=-